MICRLDLSVITFYRAVHSISICKKGTVVEEVKRERSLEGNKLDQPTTRRKLLKMMATTAGAMGASFILPAKWTKPLIDMVILPAHAATSVETSLEIRSFSITPIPFSKGPPPSPYQKWVTHSWNFEYEDAECGVIDENTTLHFNVSNGGYIDFIKCEGSASSPERLSAIGATLNDSCSGSVHFYFLTNATGETINMSLNVNGRESNWITSGIITNALVALSVDCISTPK